MDETHFEFHPGPECPTREVLEAFAAGAKVETAYTSHVAGCEACGAFVRLLRGVSLDLKPLLQRLDETAPTNDPYSDAMDDDQSRQVPGYTIVSELGEGGQGTVYRAVQASTKQAVALKLLRAGRFATPQQRARVEREAELVASLRHPGIVVIHDRLPARGGQYAIVMELIDGVPLDRWKSKSERTTERRREALRVFVRICDAVAFAHRNGVIHRDLKPSNILVDAEGQPHLLDFGIAKAMDDRYAELTMTGDALFTPAYASPEQVMQEATDTLTDVYSLGVILYKQVCGRFPYKIEGSIREISAAICDEAPTPPREVDRTIDADLETILLRALQKERARRYASVAEFGEDVDRYLRQLPIQAKRDSAWYVLGLWARRNRGVIAYLGGAAIFLVAVGMFAREAKRTKDEAAQRTKLAEQKTVLANAETEREKQRTTETMNLYRAEADRSAASSNIMRELVESVDPSIRAEGAKTSGKSENPARARIQYMLIEADQSVTRRSPEALATVSSELAWVAVSAGVFSSAESGFIQAITILLRQDEREGSALAEARDSALARARFGLAELYLTKGEQYLDAAKALVEEVLKFRLAKFKEASPEYAESLDQLARAQWQGARLKGREQEVAEREKAGKTLERALKASLDNEGQAPELRIKGVLARILRTRAQFEAGANPEQAVECWKQALVYSFEAEGDRHPSTLGILNELGAFLRHQGSTYEERVHGHYLSKLAETLRSPASSCALVEALEELLGHKKSLFPNAEDPNLAETHVAIGIQWMILKDYGRAAEGFGAALPILQKSVEVVEPILNEKSVEVVEPVLNCLEQIALNGQFADAKSANAASALVRFVNVSSERDLSLRSPAVEAQRAASLALLLDARGLKREAADSADRALRLASISPFTLLVAETWERAGWVLAKNGAPADGARAIEAARAAYVDLVEARPPVRLRVAARLAAARLFAALPVEDALGTLDRELLAATLPLGDASTREALTIVIRVLEQEGDFSRGVHYSWWLHADQPPPSVR